MYVFQASSEGHDSKWAEEDDQILNPKVHKCLPATFSTGAKVSDSMAHVNRNSYRLAVMTCVAN